MDLNGGRLVACSVRTHDGALLDNVKHVEDFFWQLIRQIQMKPLANPQAFVVPPDERAVGDLYADDGGLTMQCVISTSHIAYHSWPLQRRFRLVVDSCKDFQAEAVEQVVRSFFSVKEMVVQDVPYEDPCHGQPRQAASEETAAARSPSSRRVEATA